MTPMGRLKKDTSLPCLQSIQKWMYTLVCKGFLTSILDLSRWMIVSVLILHRNLSWNQTNNRFLPRCK